MVLVVLTACNLYNQSDDDGPCRGDRCGSETQGADSCEPGTCGAPPPCPLNYVATTRNGCYTGRCLPASECAPTACRAVTTEAACAARSDCVRIYRGDGCTCTPSSCTCETRSYERCDLIRD